MAEFSSVAKSAIMDNLMDIKKKLDLDFGSNSVCETDSFDDIMNHNLFGIHIKNLNDALSEERPHICIGWSKLGDLSDAISLESLIAKYDQEWPDAKPRSKGQNVGQIWRFVRDVQIGDYVIYAENDVCHIGKVTSAYYYDANEHEGQSSDYKNVRDVIWLKTNIPRANLSQAFHLSLGTAMSIWTLNDYKAAVLALLNGTYVKDQPLETDVSDMYASEIKNCLGVQLSPRIRKKYPLNFIIFGAPGTGKTYSTAEYALGIIENKDIDEIKAIYTSRRHLMDVYRSYVVSEQIVFTTFHQNYGYEEFIQGLRPNIKESGMSFRTVDGVFKRIADCALNAPEKDFVIIIDEINRANISKVFGELITLIEGDKRWGELNETCATLQSGDVFAVPNNLYIVGTMNSADKSISLIDAALRRRFDFIEQKPDSKLVPNGILRKVFESINEHLVSELDSTDLLVGHSYFMDKEDKDLCTILNNNIIPLLYEYFYDNRKKVATLLKNVIDKSGANIEIVDEKVGRLSVKDKVD